MGGEEELLKDELKSGHEKIKEHIKKLLAGQSYHQVDPSVSDWNQKDIDQLEEKTTYELSPKEEDDENPSADQKNNIEDDSSSEKTQETIAPDCDQEEEDLQEFKGFKEEESDEDLDENGYHGYIPLGNENDISNSPKTTKKKVGKSKKESSLKKSGQKSLLSFWDK